MFRPKTVVPSRAAQVLAMSKASSSRSLPLKPSKENVNPKTPGRRDARTPGTSTLTNPKTPGHRDTRTPGTSTLTNESVFKTPSLPRILSDKNTAARKIIASKTDSVVEKFLPQNKIQETSSADLEFDTAEIPFNSTTNTDIISQTFLDEINSSKEEMEILDKNDNSLHEEEIVPAEEEEIVVEKTQSKTKKRYTSSKFQESIKNRPKQNKNSTKVKSFLKSFKSIKKSLFLLQQKAGTDLDFFLAVKNNVQTSDRARSAGKTLIFTKGDLREKFWKGGIKPDRRQFICKNVEDMQEEIEDIVIEESEESIESDESGESGESGEENILISDDEEISDKTRVNDESYFFDDAVPGQEDESPEDRGCLIRSRNPDKRIDIERKRKREEKKRKEKRQFDESRVDILNNSSSRGIARKQTKKKTKTKTKTNLNRNKKRKTNVYNMKSSAKKVRTPGDGNFIV